jgi:peptidoglycan/xylan/chitin deacetylase (PgdA/CDA1 family)
VTSFLPLLASLLVGVTPPPPGRTRELSPRDRELLAVCQTDQFRRVDVRVASIVEWRERRGRPYRVIPADAGLPEGHIAFTFDDGPDERATPKIRALLGACGVYGHFFIPGTRVGGPKARWAIAELKGLFAEGHVIGSHSATHPSFTRGVVTSRDRRRELDRGREALEATLDIRPELFRLPYGEGHWDSEVLFEISRAGLVNLHWNITSDDAKDKAPKEPGFQGLTADEVLARIERSLDFSRRPGERLGHGVLVVHDTNYRVAALLPTLLNRLVTRGYTFVRFVGPLVEVREAEEPTGVPRRW